MIRILLALLISCIVSKKSFSQEKGISAIPVEMEFPSGAIVKTSLTDLDPNVSIESEDICVKIYYEKTRKLSTEEYIVEYLFMRSISKDQILTRSANELRYTKGSEFGFLYIRPHKGKFITYMEAEKCTISSV
ncbi:MAG: hypothetical protein MRY83_12925, partial [Flavobacteriales bacterium]|nr:hypothetical protein [Flavobacteriales bacterium]